MINKLDYVLDRLGSFATEEGMHREFDGKTIMEIVTILDRMFPQDNNSTLAAMIRDLCE